VKKPSSARHERLLSALSRTLQARREYLGMSQEEVATKAGLHRTYISDIERGARNLSVKNLSRLAEALDMNASNLLQAAEAYASEMTPPSEVTTEAAV
jgi:transcriptional regulator with XRE-family HTH domain